MLKLNLKPRSQIWVEPQAGKMQTPIRIRRDLIIFKIKVYIGQFIGAHLLWRSRSRRWCSVIASPATILPSSIAGGRGDWGLRTGCDLYLVGHRKSRPACCMFHMFQNASSMTLRQPCAVATVGIDSSREVSALNFRTANNSHTPPPKTAASRVILPTPRLTASSFAPA